MARFFMVHCVVWSRMSRSSSLFSIGCITMYTVEQKNCTMLFFCNNCQNVLQWNNYWHIYFPI